MIPEIESAEANENYKIIIVYKNGEKRLFDMKPYLKYEIYNKLKKIEYFKKIKPVGETIEWQNGEDVSPESLYYEGEKMV